MELLKDEIVPTHNGSNVVILIANVQSVNELKETRFKNFTVSVQKNILTIVENVKQKLDLNNEYLVKLTYLHFLAQLYYHQDEVPPELRALSIELIRNNTPLFPPEKKSVINESSFFDFKNTSDDLSIVDNEDEEISEDSFINPDEDNTDDDNDFEDPTEFYNK